MKDAYCEDCAARPLPPGCQGRNSVLIEEDHLHWDVASCGKVESSGGCAVQEMHLCQIQGCVNSSMHCLKLVTVVQCRHQSDVWVTILANCVLCD